MIIYESFADKVKRVITVDLWFKYSSMLNPNYMRPPRGKRHWLYIFGELLLRYREVILAYSRYIFGYWSGWFYDRRMRKFKDEKLV